MDSSLAVVLRVVKQGFDMGVATMYVCPMPAIHYATGCITDYS